MKRQVWTVEEIANILHASNQASGLAAAAVDSQNTERLVAYREGFRAALLTVASAIGIDPEVMK
jgi:hypothetical protein